MSSLLNVQCGEGERVDIRTATMRNPEQGINTDEHIGGMAEARLPPLTDGVPEYLQRRHDEDFCAISGTVRLTGGDAVHDTTPHTMVMPPAEIEYIFEGASDQLTVMLPTFALLLYVQYFRDMAEMIASDRAVTSESMGAIMSRYAAALATSDQDRA